MGTPLLVHVWLVTPPLGITFTYMNIHAPYERPTKWWCSTVLPHYQLYVSQFIRHLQLFWQVECFQRCLYPCNMNMQYICFAGRVLLFSPLLFSWLRNFLLGLTTYSLAIRYFWNYHWWGSSLWCGTLSLFPFISYCYCLSQSSYFHLMCSWMIHANSCTLYQHYSLCLFLPTFFHIYGISPSSTLWFYPVMILILRHQMDLLPFFCCRWNYFYSDLCMFLSK